MWVDLLWDYVEQMIRYRTRNLIEKVDREMEGARMEVEQLQEALSSRETEMVEQYTAQQEEISELNSQLAVLNTSAKKFRKLRQLMLLFVAMCWVVAPGSLAITLAATMIAVLMYLV